MIERLASDHANAEITAADQCMLDYVVKLSRSAGKICERDVATLRAHGFDDRAIHDICSLAAYFAFVNRMADGLGVELEDRQVTHPGARPRRRA